MPDIPVPKRAKLRLKEAFSNAEKFPPAQPVPTSEVRYVERPAERRTLAWLRRQRHQELAKRQAARIKRKN